MTNRNFDEWLSKFRPSISSYDYYIDFEKVVRNVDEIKVHDLDIRNITQYIFDWYGIGAGRLQDNQQHYMAENESTSKLSMSMLHTFYRNHFMGKEE